MSILLKRLAIAVAVFVIAGSAVMIATFFFFAAIYFWFDEILSPPLAALATMGTLLAFALIVIIAGTLIATRLKRSRPRRRFDWLLELLDAPDGLSAAAIGNALGRKLQAFARENTQATIIASLLAGLAIGISPGLRALLRDVLKD